MFRRHISVRTGPKKIRRRVRFGMIAENSISCPDLDGVFSYNYGITGNGIVPGNRVQEAVADDDDLAGDVVEAQEQGRLHQVHGLAVSTSIQLIALGFNLASHSFSLSSFSPIEYLYF